jgi:hypothetical protein
MLNFMKCHKCGRIFVYYGDRKNPHCPNTRCHTMITANSKTRLNSMFSTGVPRGWTPQKMADRVLIYLLAFNNEISLAADIYSTDGLHFVTIPLNSDKLKITVDDMLLSMQEKHRNPVSGIMIRSGKYPINYALSTVIRSKIPN